MKYATISKAGTLELRQDSSEALPAGAIGPLTDNEYVQLECGSHTIVGGQIVINPNPPEALP